MIGHDEPPATSGTPRLVLMLSESWTLVDPRDVRSLVGLAAEAERAGVDGILLGEHVAIGPEADAIGPAANPREWVGPGNQAARYPHHQPLQVLAGMAATTTTIRLIASALLSPLRHPLVLAKEVATLDLLSEGRLVHMSIPGSFKEEYDSVGLAFHQRGELFDEQLEIWERLWREDYVTYEGRHFSFDQRAFEPKAWRPEGPTMWTGANRLHPRALRRTVRYASGYFPVFPPSDEELERLRDAMARAGRSMRGFELVDFIGMATPFPGDDSVKELAPQLEAVPTQIARGTTTFVLKPSQYVDHVDQFGDFCRDAVMGLRERAGG